MSSPPVRAFLDNIENDSADSSVLMNINNSRHLRLDESEAIVNEHKRVNRKLFYSSPRREEKRDNIESKSSTVAKPSNEQPVREIIISKKAFQRQQKVEPWEFNKVIRRGYSEKLPANYDLKKWTKPTNTMLTSVIHLLDNNCEYAIENILNKYKEELERVTKYNDKAVRKIYKQKQDIMEDIVNKIKHRLIRSKFPSRLADKDLDIEYIFAKRKFIQDRYTQELGNAERIELDLIRSQNELVKLRNVSKKMKSINKKKLVEKLINNNLHSSLTQSISNSVDVDYNGNKFTFNNGKFANDKMELNLDIPESDDEEEPQLNTTTNNITENQEYNAMKYLSSLKDYQQISTKLATTIDSILTCNNGDSFETML